MKKFERTVEIAVPVKAAWKILQDVERWPGWTESMARVELRSPPPCTVGTKVWIEQPRLKPGLWTITSWDADDGFTWEQRQFGLHIVGDHRLRSSATGCRLTLQLQFEGMLSAVVSWFGQGIINRYLDLEAAGFRHRCKQVA